MPPIASQAFSGLSYAPPLYLHPEKFRFSSVLMPKRALVVSLVQAHSCKNMATAGTITPETVSAPQ